MKKWVEAPTYHHSAGCYRGVALLGGQERGLTSLRKTGPFMAGNSLVAWDPIEKIWVTGPNITPAVFPFLAGNMR